MRWTHDAPTPTLRGMKLYFSPLACSLASRITALEADLDLAFVEVDAKTKRAEDGTDFRAVNPLGLVPALALDDGRVLTENAAVLQHLADTKPDAGLAPPAGTFERRPPPRMAVLRRNGAPQGALLPPPRQDDTGRRPRVRPREARLTPRPRRIRARRTRLPPRAPQRRRRLPLHRPPLVGRDADRPLRLANADGVHGADACAAERRARRRAREGSLPPRARARLVTAQRQRPETHAGGSGGTHGGTISLQP